MTSVDHRDRVSTVSELGRRVWLFPRQPKGRHYNWRTLVSWLLLGALVVLPFLERNGHPMVMFNVLERKFSIVGYMFWPQDMFIFGILTVTLAVFVVLFTAIYGRIWCGWMCPQTIFLEMVFRKVDYWLMGDHGRQRELHHAPWSAKKFFIMAARHVSYIVISFIIGNILLSWIISGRGLLTMISEPPQQHLHGLLAMLAFTLFFYWFYIWFREQFCCFLCPYARLQSVLIDRNTIGVSYDPGRGEPRGKPGPQHGDCVDCHKCVQVCPTGIDIRNGFPQLECINCTACIDACEEVMTKIGKPIGLVRYASQNMLQNGGGFKWTPRVLVYTLLLMGLAGFSGWLISTRKTVDVTLLRRPGSLPISGAGLVSNVFNLNIINKGDSRAMVSLVMEGKADVSVRIPAGVIEVQPQESKDSILFIDWRNPPLSGPKMINLELKVEVNGMAVDRVKTTFLLP